MKCNEELEPIFVKLLRVQRRPKPPAEEKPPNVVFVTMVSLFGYPGAGHLMLGERRWGAFYAAVFTLGTLATVSEVWYLFPELWKMYQGHATTISRLPNFPRLALWIIITGVGWIASGWHSAVLAQKAVQNLAPGELPPKVEAES